MKFFKFILIFSLLCGCQTIKNSIKNLQETTNRKTGGNLIGKEKSKLIASYGDPEYVDTFGDIEILTYKTEYFLIKSDIVFDDIEKSELVYEINILAMLL